MQQRYNAFIEALLGDPATSPWLREAILELGKKDPVDAAMDAAILAKAMDYRMANAHGISRAVVVSVEPSRASFVGQPATRAALL